MNNPPNGLGDMVRQANCLVHARRNFFELRYVFREYCDPVLTQLAKIWKAEQECREMGFDDNARLKHHQKHSLPVMKDLKKTGERLLADHEIEPNSDLGAAWKYFLRHYDKLVAFTKIPGCPVDNNETERLLKKAILHRKNSLFYRTQVGCGVGDVIMTLAFTGLEAGVDLHKWFSDMAENPDDVKNDPEAWLPWNWKQNRNWLPWQERSDPDVHYEIKSWEEVKKAYPGMAKKRGRTKPASIPCAA